ncbi:MAG: hypothetical protein IPP71_10185 [Bacteroidetes bacterium]|nr:hypothetical protein [Bacteroidota bacterium]
MNPVKQNKVRSYEQEPETYWGVIINAIGYSWKTIKLYFYTLYKFVLTSSQVVQGRISGSGTYMHPAKFFFASTVSVLIFNFLLTNFKGEAVPSDNVEQYLQWMETVHGNNPTPEIKQEIQEGVRRLQWIDEQGIGTKTGNVLSFFFCLLMSVALIPLVRIFTFEKSGKELFFYNGYLTSFAMLLTLTGQFIGYFLLPYELGNTVSSFCFVFGFILFPMLIFYRYVRNSIKTGIMRSILFFVSYLCAWLFGSVILSLSIDLYLSSPLFKLENLIK